MKYTIENLIEEEIDANPTRFFSWLYENIVNDQILLEYAKSIKSLDEWESDLDEQISGDLIDRKIKQTIEEK